MKKIQVQTPAKINLTLEILGLREDGFHEIKSVMHSINLFDIITIELERSETLEIILQGDSTEIPYDKNNLAYKAAAVFFEKLYNPAFKVKIYIEKNIPVAAGLAGGSSNAAGVIFGLNELFDQKFSRNKLHEICSTLGSDVNFCLEGGCKLTTSRGEILQELPHFDFNLTLIKPKHLQISTADAYKLFDKLKPVPFNDFSDKIIGSSDKNTFEKYIFNDLERAVLPHFETLRLIKEILPNAHLSGSGPSFFIIGEHKIPPNDVINNSDFLIIENLTSTSCGIHAIIE